jgi:hypothetical protein
MELNGAVGSVFVSVKKEFAGTLKSAEFGLSARPGAPYHFVILQPM